MSRVDESVFHLMRRALQDHGAHWHAKLPDLTKPQYAALIVIDESEEIDQASVGQQAAIDKATLAGLMARLEQRGLITRTVGEDRRRRIVRLTNAGKKALQETRAAADVINGSMLQRLTEAERVQLCKLLAKLAD
jgi:MarR family transcriptional regulator, temperature-dependent positive regulator of motility